MLYHYCTHDCAWTTSRMRTQQPSLKRAHAHSHTHGHCRWTLKRVVPGSLSTKDYSGRCWAFNDGNMRTFASECFDGLTFCQDSTCLFGREDHSPFGTFVNSSKYYWQSVCVYVCMCLMQPVMHEVEHGCNCHLWAPAKAHRSP